MVTLTKSTKPQKEKQIERRWYLIDLSKKPLGRIATEIAILLQGKHKTNFTTNLDSGDYVVAINAKKTRVSGKKAQAKTYKRYSGYPGGLKTIPWQKMLDSKPQEIIRHAVSGMLPKNKLRQRRLTRLFVFPHEEHPYQDKFKVKN